MEIGCAKLLIICLIIIKLYFTKSEVFTATADIEQLLQSEQSITTMVKSYIESEMIRLERLSKIGAKYDKQNKEAINAGLGYVGNPLNSYILIKRLTTEWDNLENLMLNNMANDFLNNVTNQRKSNSIRFPDDEDLKGAAVGLMRLQDVYKLNSKDIANGNIQGRKSAGKLKSYDCFELGLVAYNEKDYYHALMWIQEAWDLVQHEKTSTTDVSEILEHLAYALFQQGNPIHALVITRKLKVFDPNHFRVDSNLNIYQEYCQDSNFTNYCNDENVNFADLPPIQNPRHLNIDEVLGQEIYEALCRNEHPLPEKTKSKLYCYYKNNRPYLKLAPIKVEVAFLDPEILLFRNVMSDKEIEFIKEISMPLLERAEIINDETGDSEPAKIRISKSAFLPVVMYETLQQISARQEDMTDLSMQTAEDLQVANYGIGGHYTPHYDHASKEENGTFKGITTGNRIATILHYMSTPEAGGATVFPVLKVAVFPTKYDAVFWHNLLRNGEGDPRTLHAACPVLIGSKWVSNRWLHEQDQEFRRPCTLSQNE